MSRLITFLVFIGFFFLLDLYVFQGYKVLVKKWAPNYVLLLNIIYWAIPIALVLTIIGIMVWSQTPAKSKAMMWASSLLFGLFIAKTSWLVFMIIDDFSRLFRFSAQKITANSSSKTVSRSEFIVTTGALVAGTLFGTMMYGIIKGAHNYQIQLRKLRLKNLPKAFQGFKIVQISDVHSGSFWSKDEVSKGIQKILDQKPDAIFFTGDLVNNTSDEFDGFKEIFGRLRAPYGVYSVLGNHDYGDYYKWPSKTGMTKEQNLENLKNHHKEMGWNLLMNEHRVIEKDGDKLAILGVENWSAHKRFPKYGSLSRAYEGAKEVENKLLLSHDPSHWRAEVLSSYPSIDATFSGHTHGMQFGIDTKYYRWSPVKYQYPEWVDLYKENDQYLYVNRGFGYLGYPGRVGFLPEITVFELDTA